MSKELNTMKKRKKGNSGKLSMKLVWQKE